MNAKDDPLEMYQAFHLGLMIGAALHNEDFVAAVVASGGFEVPVQLLQTGLIHAWFARRTP
ncbi:MAG TPA: hypothetical protein VMG10_05780 [Gemmataceae bacterium]|nr:hypothetical protein [Gemmataceae bacterium]